MRPSPDPEHDAKPDQEPGRVRQLQMSGQYTVYLVLSQVDILYCTTTTTAIYNTITDREHFLQQIEVVCLLDRHVKMYGGLH